MSPLGNSTTASSGSSTSPNRVLWSSCVMGVPRRLTEEVEQRRLDDARSRLQREHVVDLAVEGLEVGLAERLRVAGAQVRRDVAQDAEHVACRARRAAEDLVAV